MRALAADLPNGILAGFRAGHDLALPNGEGGARVYAVGMGGSGIAADLARGIVDAESRLSLTVVRGPVLPRSVDERSKVLLVSYSGDTWETVRAYDAAGRAHAQRVVITSGGALAERAEHDDVPVVRLPPGMPPRSAVGHMLGGVLGLLDPVFPESNETRVARAAERLRTQIGAFARTGGPAESLAGAIGDRLPFFYAESSFVALARRWKTQIEENAKRIAVFDELPELLHNALVGWDATAGPEAGRHTVVLLEWASEEPLVRRSFRYLETLLADRKVRSTTAVLSSDDRLEALFEGIALGDQVSLALAARRKVDPYPVEAITRLKSALAVRSPPALEEGPRRRGPSRRSGRSGSGRSSPANA
jgi:glucose/mannose-6-phosphate isomerase